MGVCACVYTKGACPSPSLLRLGSILQTRSWLRTVLDSQKQTGPGGAGQKPVLGPSYLTRSLLTLRAAFQGLLRFLDPDGPARLTPTLLCDSPCLLP